jgi:hypothetical protein
VVGSIFWWFPFAQISCSFVLLSLKREISAVKCYNAYSESEKQQNRLN